MQSAQLTALLCNKTPARKILGVYAAAGRGSKGSEISHTASREERTGFLSWPVSPTCSLAVRVLAELLSDWVEDLLL